MRTLSPATPDDLKDVCELVNSAYRGESSRAGWTTEADFLDGQRTDLETLAFEIQVGTILILKEDDKLLGCVFLENPNPDGSSYLGMLTVRPTQQASGIGREILEGAEAYARARGAKKITLGVVQVRESLIAWYLRRGYKANGETKPFPYGNEKFGIPKRQDLHFVMFEKPL